MRELNDLNVSKGLNFLRGREQSHSFHIFKEVKELVWTEKKWKSQYIREFLTYKNKIKKKT